MEWLSVTFTTDSEWIPTASDISVELPSHGLAPLAGPGPAAGIRDQVKPQSSTTATVTVCASRTTPLVRRSSVGSLRV
eukprot:486648-Rhodomonas_salina.1